MLSNRELKQITGGGITAGIFLGGLFTFLIGLIDGYVRPYACR